MIGLAKIILEMYNDFIVPLWHRKQIKLQEANENFAAMVHEKELDLGKTWTEYKEWDLKQTSNLI